MNVVSVLVKTHVSCHRAAAVILGANFQPGCYNDAVVGVDAVIHTASPLDTQNEGDPANVIGPAVAGVTGILDSLEKFGNAKRIVTLR
jgi:nucleoside-diphosphate-sugar epimerase